MLFMQGLNCKMHKQIPIYNGLPLLDMLIDVGRRVIIYCMDSL